MSIDIKHGNTIEFNGLPTLVFTPHRMALPGDVSELVTFMHQAYDMDEEEYMLVEDANEQVHDAFKEGHDDGHRDGLRAGFDHTLDQLHALLVDGKSLKDAIQALSFADVRKREYD